MPNSIKLEIHDKIEVGCLTPTKEEAAYDGVVQKRLGHSSIQIMLTTYNHVAPGLQEAAATRFDEAFSNRYNKRENEAIGKHY